MLAPSVYRHPAIDGATHPVRAMDAYLTVRPINVSNNLPFCHTDGTPLTHYQFGAVLNKVINRLHLNEVFYKSHSFRIAAATWLDS